MSFDVLLSDLKRIYGVDPRQARQPNTPRGRLTEEDVQKWSALTGSPRSFLYDQIAIYLARGFHGPNYLLSFAIAL
jgi:hypothetical protein